MIIWMSSWLKIGFDVVNHQIFADHKSRRKCVPLDAGSFD